MTSAWIASWSYEWTAAGYSPRTMTEMRAFVERLEKALEADGRSLETATRIDCAGFLAAIESPTRRQWGWRSLRSFYKHLAAEEGKPSPMERIKSPKVPISANPSTVTEAEVLRLIRACAPFRAATNARDAALIAVLWSTGMRRSECSND